MKTAAAALCLSAILALMAHPAPACSVFNFNRADGTFVGRNMDWVSTSVGWISFLPPADGNFGVIYFGADDHIWAQGGMNDQGLVLAMAATPYLEIPDQPDKLPVGLDFWDLLMSRCATVDEVLAFIDLYDLASLPNYFERGHFLFTDRNGASAIVEGDEVFIKSGDHQVITNFLHSRPDLGGWPCPRYDLIEDRLSDPDASFDDAYLMATVEAAHGSLWGGFTVWSLFYDLTNRRVTVFYRGDFSRGIDFYVVEQLDKAVYGYQMETLFQSLVAWDGFESGDSSAWTATAP